MNGIPRTSHVLLGVLALFALVFGWLAWSRVKPPGAASELLRHAPPDAQIYAFLDVELLRRTGLLEMLAGGRGGEELEYQRFVEQSGFNYRQHLDAVVMARRGTAQYAVIAGRFNSPRLLAYAQANQGTCTAGYCYVPGTPPISFAPIRPGLYAFASGSGDARELLNPHAPAVQGAFLDAPVWAAGLGPKEVPLLQALPGVERLSLWFVPRLPATVELRFALDAKDPKSATAAARELGTLAHAGEFARYLSKAQVEAAGRQVNGRMPLAIDLIQALLTGPWNR